MADLFCNIPDLTCRLHGLLAQVPAGRVTTCGALAEALGNRVAARWVGQFTLEHNHTAGCPCHRVVRAEGRIGPYIDGGATAKARRLAAEGIRVQDDAVDLERHGFDAFVSDRPLEALRRVQEALQDRVSLRPRRRIPKLVGGVDVSYPRGDGGVAAYALVETDSGRLVWSITVRRPVRFPYVTTYLAFRELPILLELLDEVRRAGRISRVLLVDGSGILHQRHAGIATHLGVVASLPTIGVTKKLLCGRVDLAGMQPGESRPVVHEDRLIGVALCTGPNSRRPIFVSPGHLVDVTFAERLVRRLVRGRRLPEPLYWADRLSRRESSVRDR
jgi:deoxyribonuclease V